MLYLKTDITLLADVFEKFIRVSTEEYEIILLYFVSLSGYTWQCGMNKTDKKLPSIQDKGSFLLMVKIIHGGFSSVMDMINQMRKNVSYIDDNILQGWAIYQALPYSRVGLFQNLVLKRFDNKRFDTPKKTFYTFQ